MKDLNFIIVSVPLDPPLCPPATPVLLFIPVLQPLTLLPLILFHCYVPHKKEAAYKAASAILFGSENTITGVAEARDNITMVI